MIRHLDEAFPAKWALSAIFFQVPASPFRIAAEMFGLAGDVICASGASSAAYRVLR